MKRIDQQVIIDGIDKQLLRALMEDARRSILEISRSVGISGAAIHQRLRKLESAGIIASSNLKVNPKILGYTTMAFIGFIWTKLCVTPRLLINSKKFLKFWNVIILQAIGVF
jgi:Lrp/AsnC family transcriptional regulator for asnA, asnC and gidA